MADRDDLNDSLLTLVDEAFCRLLDESDAHLHVTGFAEGDVAFVLTRDGLEVRRRAEVYGSKNQMVCGGESKPGAVSGRFGQEERLVGRDHGRPDGPG